MKEMYLDVFRSMFVMVWQNLLLAKSRPPRPVKMDDSTLHNEMRKTRLWSLKYARNDAVEKQPQIYKKIYLINKRGPLRRR